MTETQKISNELSEEKETYGLYDLVKKDIYLKMINALGKLNDINTKDIPAGAKEIPYMKYGSDFVAAIIDLWVLLGPKLEYITDERLKKISELEDYYFQRNGKSPANMTFSEAKEYFWLQRLFIEKLGITRFEFEKLEPAERILREAFSSD
jgi:uncharacterized protein YkuJ